MGIQEVK